MELRENLIRAAFSQQEKYSSAKGRLGSESLGAPVFKSGHRESTLSLAVQTQHQGQLTERTERGRVQRGREELGTRAGGKRKLTSLSVFASNSTEYF